MTNTSIPPRKFIDTRWLEVFDSVYCGDPRPADVPAMNFWRSKDVYSDHMVRLFELNNYPLSRIDNSGFMVGTTGTCYFRKTEAWQGMLLLDLARGGWINTYYGNLDLLTDANAQWFAKAQSMYLPLQHAGNLTTFGALPGDAKPYGFSAMRDSNGLLTVVNPSQSVATIDLPTPSSDLRLLFRDAGFTPTLTGSRLTLGPEQLAVIGVGSYASPDFDLGIGADVLIPQSIEPLPATFTSDTDKSIVTTLTPPSTGTLRILFRQLEPNGQSKRTTGGAPPAGTTLGCMLRIEAKQGTRDIPVKINYDKAIWSGLSWAVGELSLKDLAPSQPLTIRCSTTEPAKVTLHGELHRVQY